MLEVNRVEKKYLLDRFLMKDMIARLERCLQTDRHNGPDGYMVRTLYFDSYKDCDYQAKLCGLDDRKKIRLRIYHYSDTVAKLELKEKHNGWQRKRSIPVGREEALELIDGNFTCLLSKKEKLAQVLYAYMTKEVYRPVCIVEYDRYAMIEDTNSIRVTFDQNLKVSRDVKNLFGETIHYQPLDLTDKITMEVKYDGFLLSDIKKALSVKVATESSISKYIRAREKMI